MYINCGSGLQTDPRRPLMKQASREMDLLRILCLSLVVVSEATSATQTVYMDAAPYCSKTYEDTMKYDGDQLSVEGQSNATIGLYDQYECSVKVKTSGRLRVDFQSLNIPRTDCDFKLDFYEPLFFESTVSLIDYPTTSQDLLLQKVSVFTSDKLQIEITVGLQYSLRENDLQLLREKYGSGYRSIVESSALAEIKGSTTKYLVGEAVTNRENLERSLAEAVQLRLEGVCCLPSCNVSQNFTDNCRNNCLPLEQCSAQDKGLFVILHSCKLRNVRLPPILESRIPYLFLQNEMQNKLASGFVREYTCNTTGIPPPLSTRVGFLLAKWNRVELSTNNWNYRLTITVFDSSTSATNTSIMTVTETTPSVSGSQVSLASVCFINVLVLLKLFL